MGGIAVKKHVKLSAPGMRAVVFQPALVPLEASVLPAMEKRPLGALRQAAGPLRRVREPLATDAGLTRQTTLVRQAAARLSGRRSASGR